MSHVLRSALRKSLGQVYVIGSVYTTHPRVNLQCASTSMYIQANAMHSPTAACRTMLHYLYLCTHCYLGCRSTQSNAS